MNSGVTDTRCPNYVFCRGHADGIWHRLLNFKRVPTFMNIGTGKDPAVNEDYETVARVIGWSGRFKHNLDRPVGMERKVVSTDKQAALVWFPKTPLEDGIRFMFEHCLESVA